MHDWREHRAAGTGPGQSRGLFRYRARCLNTGPSRGLPAFLAAALGAVLAACFPAMLPAGLAAARGRRSSSRVSAPAGSFRCQPASSPPVRCRSVTRHGSAADPRCRSRRRRGSPHLAAKRPQLPPHRPCSSRHPGHPPLPRRRISARSHERPNQRISPGCMTWTRFSARTTRRWGRWSLACSAHREDDSESWNGTGPEGLTSRGSAKTPGAGLVSSSGRRGAGLRP
jgi:hypothetical protein